MCTKKTWVQCGVHKRYTQCQFDRTLLIVHIFLAQISEKTRTSLYNRNGTPLIKFNYSGTDLKFELFPDGLGISELYEVFFENTYGVFDYNGKIVIDIGGFIGNTATYFAVNGAKKVYVYEPFPPTFKLLRENIKLNNLNDVIIPKNVGIGHNDSIVEMGFSNTFPGSSGCVTDVRKISSSKYTIQIQDITKVLDSIGEVDVIKMDCEGCEYQVINRLVESGYIDKINEGLVMEVHEGEKLGKLNDIVGPLKNSGFKTKILKRNKGEINLYILKAWR